MKRAPNNNNLKSVYVGKVYCLTNPTTLKSFYVGITSGELNKRLYQHIKNPCNDKLKKVIDRITAKGLKPMIRVLEYHTNYRTIGELEMKWIAVLKKSGAKLCNKKSIYK